MRGGADGSGDGVGDVVKFEVEEDAEAAVAKLIHDAVAERVVELHADLVPVACLAEAIDESEGLGFVWVVEGYGEAVPGGDLLFGGGHDFSLASQDEETIGGGV